MTAEWLAVLHDDTLTCIGMVRGYSLTVVGKDDRWLWSVGLAGLPIADGVDTRLASAKVTAEATAHWLAARRGTT